MGEQEEQEFKLPDEDGGGEMDMLRDLPRFDLGDAAETVTEIVRLEIQQKATLEREGFDARLELTNGTGTGLVSLSVSPRVRDQAGQDVTDRFYVVPPELDGIAAIDGSAGLAHGATMRGRWILIPGEGLGGTDLDGKPYYVKAVLTYYQNGRLKEVVTNEVEITVHPQPKLYLHYYIPREVEGDVPFKLGLLVENDGDGIATNLKIDSGQPQIVDNQAGLLIDFRIVGSSFGSVTGDIARLVLGDVQPHSFVSGYWIMQSTLDGKFVEFTAEMTHRAYKGVQINPLILGVSTEIIEHDRLFADAQDPDNHFSLIDRDKDGFPDYLINLTSGLRLPILIPQNVQVTRSPTPEDRTLELVVPETHGYVCIVMPDPMPEANIRSISKAGPPGGEDTYLSGNNFWRAHGNLYFVDELGFIDEQGREQPESATYTLDFRSALVVEEVNVTPNEFDILWTDNASAAGGLELILHEPEPDSAVGRYEFVEPVFYLGLPPTVGYKAAVRAVITNNGVTPESGLVTFTVVQPDQSEVVLGQVDIDDLRAWRHVYPLVEWTPQMAGRHQLRASLGTDSPEAMLDLEVVVNDPPFADAGADFAGDVLTELTFDGTRSIDSDGYLLNYFWDFGDDIWGGGMTPNHVYQHSGTRKVQPAPHHRSHPQREPRASRSPLRRGLLRRGRTRGDRDHRCSGRARGPLDHPGRACHQRPGGHPGRRRHAECRPGELRKQQPTHPGRAHRRRPAAGSCGPDHPVERTSAPLWGGRPVQGALYQSGARGEPGRVHAPPRGQRRARRRVPA